MGAVWTAQCIWLSVLLSHLGTWRLVLGYRANDTVIFEEELKGPCSDPEVAKKFSYLCAEVHDQKLGTYTHEYLLVKQSSGTRIVWYTDSNCKENGVQKDAGPVPSRKYGCSGWHTDANVHPERLSGSFRIVATNIPRPVKQLAHHKLKYLIWKHPTFGSYVEPWRFKTCNRVPAIVENWAENPDSGCKKRIWENGQTVGSKDTECKIQLDTYEPYVETVHGTSQVTAQSQCQLLTNCGVESYTDSNCQGTKHLMSHVVVARESGHGDYEWHMNKAVTASSAKLWSEGNFILNGGQWDICSHQAMMLKSGQQDNTLVSFPYNDQSRCIHMRDSQILGMQGATASPWSDPAGQVTTCGVELFWDYAEKGCNKATDWSETYSWVFDTVGKSAKTSNNCKPRNVVTNYIGTPKRGSFRVFGDCSAVELHFAADYNWCETLSNKYQQDQGERFKGVSLKKNGKWITPEEFTGDFADDKDMKYYHWDENEGCSLKVRREKKRKNILTDYCRSTENSGSGHNILSIKLYPGGHCTEHIGK